MKRTAATVIILLSFLYGSGLEAQSVKGTFYDCDYIIRNSQWLTSSNAAGLTVNPAGRIAVAELSFGKQDGGLIDNEASDNSLDYGIGAKSFYRLSDKIAFSGAFSYSGFHGKNMGGSVLVNPDYNPVNFYESTGGYRGVVNREKYGVSGGISYSFSPQWSIGAKIDYNAGNSTKRKDPRHRSTLMDMDISLGARFAPGGIFEMGLNFLYRKTTESILGRLYADTSINYYMLIDYGGYWGKTELFNGDLGYVSLSSQRTMFNDFYGGAAQFAFHWDKVSWFNELSYLYRNGYFGKKSESSVLFSHHNGNEFAYSGSINILTPGGNRHFIDLGGEMETLKSFENSYRYETPAGEGTIIKYLGENQRLSRTLIHGMLGWTGNWGIEKNLPRWEAGASADYRFKKSYATLYPDSRRQNISSVAATIFVRGNFIVKEKNMLSGGVDLICGGGFGNAKTDERSAASTSAAPKSSDEYLYTDFEYRTLARLGGGLSFKYTRLFPGKGIGAYILVKDSFLHSLKKVEYMSGNYRNFVEIRIGCTF